MSGKKRWKLIRLTCYTIAFLLVLYVLGFGPYHVKVFHSYRVGNHSQKLRDADSIFSVESYSFYYGPLLNVLDKNRYLLGPLNQYVDFCERLMYPD